MPTTSLPRRSLLLALGLFTVVALLFISLRNHSAATTNATLPLVPSTQQTDKNSLSAAGLAIDPSTLTGATIMPVLGNATVKAELGRAAWKLFHTIMARYPETPNADERSALTSYIHLFVRLYPCGECAEHFRQIVARFPPQVSSRNAAAAWACHVHNEVNKSLGKEMFDCAEIGDFYDCGCAEDGKEGEAKGTTEEVRRE